MLITVEYQNFVSSELKTLVRVQNIFHYCAPKQTNWQRRLDHVPVKALPVQRDFKTRHNPAPGGDAGDAAAAALSRPASQPPRR
jgi:hypothetical protein